MLLWKAIVMIAFIAFQGQGNLTERRRLKNMTKSNKLKCKQCGKEYNMLAGEICFFCDMAHWFAYFGKLKGKEGK